MLPLTATSASGLGEDARVLLDGVTYTISISIRLTKNNNKKIQKIYYYNVYKQIKQQWKYHTE